MSATTRLRRGSIRSSRPPRAGGRRCPPRRRRRPDRVAGRAHRDRPGEPALGGILATTLLLSGRSPTERPGRPPAPRRRPPRRPRRPGRSRSRPGPWPRPCRWRIDAGDLVAAGHPETTGARDHPVGEAAGRDGGHLHRRGRAGATGPGEAVVAGVLGAAQRCGVAHTTRPVAASPATTTSARIAATHRRLGAVGAARRPWPGRPGPSPARRPRARPLGQFRWRPGAP